MLPIGRKISGLKIIALVLVFTVSFFTGKFVADWGIVGSPKQTGALGAAGSGTDLPVNRLNVLLLGIDARPGEKDARTDSMVLVSIDRDTKKIAMVSIPRDTMVEIDGHGTNKINAANVLGGAELARQTVEKLLGVQIPYYVKTNFNGFKGIVDTLGGVNIDVEKKMYYPSENIDLRPGMQRLDGYNALAYVRFRHDALGDIGRTERQQKFLAALAKEMLRPVTIIKAPILVPKLMDAVETNLGVSDAIVIAKAASSLDSDNIMTATLPGVFYNYKGASYWKIDDAKAKIVLNELFEGVKVATITGPDITIPSERRAVKRTKPNTGVTPNTGKKNDESNKIPDEQVPPDQSGTFPGQDSNGAIPGQEDPGQVNPGVPQDGGTVQNGQDQGGIYPGQDAGGQYPGQNPGGQSGQEQGNQNIDGQQNTNKGTNTGGQSQNGTNPVKKTGVSPIVPQTPSNPPGGSVSRSTTGQPNGATGALTQG